MRMSTIARLAAPIAALIVSTGCSSNSAAQRQMDEFRKDIARVQADNERLNERVTALEVGGASRGPAAAAAPAGARSVAGDKPRLKVVKLAPGQAPDDDAVEEVSPAAEPAPGPEPGPPMLVQAEGKRGAAVSQTGAKEAGKAAETSQTAGREYDAALALVKRKQYDKAIEALAGYLVRFPDSPNADNAMYWRGECYFAKGDFDRTAEQMQGLLARYPYGNKVPDALLKLGLAQLRQGRRDKAQETFAQLRRDHPSSEAARKIPRE
jgi:tol-pal system protein YbgF